MESKAPDVKAMQILYIALFGGQLIFGLIFYIFSTKLLGGNTNPDLDRIFQFVCPALAVVCLIAARSRFPKKLQDILPEETLQDKLAKYREALIPALALCEGPALLCILAAGLTRNRLLWFLFLGLVLHFLTLYPSVNRIAEQLRLDGEERAALEK